jgi:hypothetical protein
MIVMRKPVWIWRLLVSGLLLILFAGCAPGASLETLATPEPIITETQPVPLENTPTPVLEKPTQVESPPVTVTQPVPVEISPIEEGELIESTPLPTPGDPRLQSLVEHAKDDLAQRLNIAKDEIDLISLEAVTWRDGSLGCPQPGMAYIQVLIDGMRIILRADKTLYHYHSGGNQLPFLCENPQEPLPPASTVDQ